MDPGGLANVMHASDHVVVVAGHAFDQRHRQQNVVLADVRGDDFAALAEVLATGEGEGEAFMTIGDPSLAFLNGRTLVAVVQCILPGYVRCEAIWSGDLPLLDPTAITRWLAAVTGHDRVGP